MTVQMSRLSTDAHHVFHGSALDRSKPLRFRLDGRLITGFAGDTVLSAAMACGTDTVGMRHDQPVALSLRHAPAILPAGRRSQPLDALPMERTPAQDGVDYVTLGKPLGSRRLHRLLRCDQRSLGLDLDDSSAMARPWLGIEGIAGPAADLVVIGGGIAGMTAALAGAKRGLRVALIEASPQLGGMAQLFGTQDGEETPEQSIARLTAAIAQSEAITVLTSSEAFALRPGMVRLHQVRIEDGRPVGHVLDIATTHVAIATGALERLPIFPGNRLPGVVGAQEAFALAQHYGIWPGQSALFATSANPAYRLATLAGDAGIAITRILDSRPQPQSRFIEFSKAYGFTLSAGSLAGAAHPAKGRGLAIETQGTLEGSSRSEPSLVVDRLVVCGGWQPDLTLWHMAGGESQWNATTARLEPTTAPEAIVLAGSAAGWFTSRACLSSGTDAVDSLLGKSRKPVDDPVIDPLYETPEAPAPVATIGDHDQLTAYLDAGHGYLKRPRPVPRRWPAWLPFVRQPPAWSLADAPRPLDLAEIIAGVQLGAIPAASAGIVAQERVAMIGMSAEPKESAASGPVRMPPAYLEGRYPGAALWVLVPQDKRLLEVGSLIQPDADHIDPLGAIGVVVRIIDGAAIALATGTAGQMVTVQQAGRAVAARLVAPFNEGMELGSALGGGAGAL